MEKILIDLTGFNKETLEEMASYLQNDKCALTYSPSDLGYKNLCEEDIDMLAETILDAIGRI